MPQKPRQAWELVSASVVRGTHSRPILAVVCILNLKERLRFFCCYPRPRSERNFSAPRAPCAPAPLPTLVLAGHPTASESSIRVHHPSPSSESSIRVQHPSPASESSIRVQHPSPATESSLVRPPKPPRGPPRRGRSSRRLREEPLPAARGGERCRICCCPAGSAAGAAAHLQWHLPTPGSDPSHWMAPSKIRVIGWARARIRVIG